ncbi:neuronal acetylcholine receptor subunit alpha-7-like [Lytechinus variegatus]|uniref:neuronal acetylcholine receptor subunit alpha-7-like n=1 Tax=Lytechinus variegatus TaxID=7654 RepID=UPI001BB28F23|nr:neuronal acetylcholine receptor subunit alpha-7-like [Lytechinus variegatus]
MEIHRLMLICWGIQWLLANNVNGIEYDDGIREWRRKLYKEVIDSYGPPTIRPIKNDSAPVKVRMRMLLEHIADFDEPKQQVTLFCSMKLIWTDEFLRWNESDYGGVKSLQVNVDQIWNPDLTLLTSNSKEFLTLNHRRAEVYSNGMVIWLSPAMITSLCLLDVKLFPFDIQTCRFVWGPWSNTVNMQDVDYFFERNETTIDRYVDNGVWEILDDTAYRTEETYSTATEPFVEICYAITFRRKSKVYVVGIIIPSVLLSLSTMIIFLLPPESGEKISFGITNLLAMVLFQETVRSAMPPTGSPIFANYICTMVVVAGASLIAEALVLRMYGFANTRPVPKCLMCFLSKDHHQHIRSGQNGEPISGVSQPFDHVVGNNDCPEQSELTDLRSPSRLSNIPATENADLWKLIASSVEHKAAIITICCIIGNFLFTFLRMFTATYTKGDHDHD